MLEQRTTNVGSSSLVCKVHTHKNLISISKNLISFWKNGVFHLQYEHCQQHTEKEIEFSKQTNRGFGFKIEFWNQIEFKIRNWSAEIEIKILKMKSCFENEIAISKVKSRFWARNCDSKKSKIYFNIKIMILEIRLSFQSRSEGCPFWATVRLPCTSFLH